MINDAPLKSASDLIDRWGGTSKVAERFNVLPSAVSNWRRTGFPPRLHYRIANEAKAESIVLADELFTYVPLETALTQAATPEPEQAA